jgi:hypothetical protein
MAVLGAKHISQAHMQGRKLFRSWNKVPSQTTASGIWFDLSMSPGNPAAQYYFAAPGKATALARSTDGGLDHGPNAPAGFKKYLHKFDIQSAGATASPLTWELLDYLAFYPGIAMDAGVLDLVTDIAIPRWSAKDGVRMMVVEQNPYVGGAQFCVTYENDMGGTTVSPTMVCNTQVVAGTIATSAPATVGCCGRFVPLAPGEAGVAKPLSVEFLTGDVGLLCIVLVKPLLQGIIFDPYSPCWYECWPDLPEIKEDAYLNLIALPVGTLAGANILGDITTIWSN